MTPDQFVERLGRDRATAILRCDDPETARRAMEAAIRGGFRLVEFTLTTPGAMELIAEFASREGLVVGAGTVLDTDQAEQAVEHGAQFLVSPVLDERVIRVAAELGVAMMPGTNTPTEMLRAHELGAPLCKLFPAPGQGPAYVRATLAPLPFLRIVPTQGVDLDNARDWLRAGAFAVGFVGPLFPAGDLAGGRWDRIEERAAQLLRAVRSVAS